MIKKKGKVSMRILRTVIRRIVRAANIDYKGRKGEFKVNEILDTLSAEDTKQKHINNFTLLDEKGKSHQIDHIVIRENGIFCIETKNFRGVIHGNEKQEKWIQTIPSSGRKYRYLNPIKQNASHVYHLSKALGDKYKINSLVVMIRNNASTIQSSNVINLNELEDYLNNYNDGIHYSNGEIIEIYNSLNDLQADITNLEHVQNIRQTKREIIQGVCPRCGGELVEREGKYGKFYGCSNFPDCKFTKNK